MFKKNTYFYITIICFVFISNCFAASDFNLPYKEGELLVRFAPKTDGKQLMATEQNQHLAALGGGTIKRSFEIVPGLVLVKLPETSSVEKALPAFRASGKFLYAMPNYRAKVLLNTPNDPYFNEITSPYRSQWGLHNTGQNGGTIGADINAPRAWDIIHDACDIIVAVIDTGVGYTHPDLAANMWTDANGHHGYDFVNNDNDPNDDAGHGTHCAGIIGAIGNNGIGVVGVCWHVKIMALKWIEPNGFGNVVDAISCIDYAVSKGVKILSNSWRWPDDYPPLKAAIEAADAAGVLFIASAGNDGSNNDFTPHYPSGYDCNNIISVMATNNNDGTWDDGDHSTNYGIITVDLAAPGGNILREIKGSDTFFALTA